RKRRRQRQAAPRGTTPKLPSPTPAGTSVPFWKRIPAAVYLGLEALALLITRARDAALQETPEVLKAVRVYAAIYVLNGMVNDLMRVVGCQSCVGHERVAVESRASFYVLADFALQTMLLAIRYDCGANLSAALKDSHDCGFVLSPRASDWAFALTRVLFTGLPADERFVYLDFAAEFGAEEVILNSKPKALQHEPCGLLSDTQSTVNLHAGDSVLAVDQQPKSGHPLIEAERRILENRSQFQSELLLALVAKPDAPGPDKRRLG